MVPSSRLLQQFLERSSDARGSTPPGVLAFSLIHQAIEGTIGGLDATQHLVGNHEIAVDGDTATHRLLDTHPDGSDGSETWELEYQRRLASLAMERVKGEFQPNTWRAFWITAVDGLPAGDAARETGLSTGAVYVAKSRVLARLKEEVEALRRQEEN